MTQQMLLLVVAAFVAGAAVVYLLCSLWYGQRLQVACLRLMDEMNRQHQDELAAVRRESVASSRAVLKGKLAEQFAPIFPEFDYLPADAKFLGDPVDYIVFDGYNAFRAGLARAEDIEIVLLDIKSGQARLSAGQKAIAQAIARGKMSFRTLNIDF